MSGRPRGFADWTPQRKTLDLLEQVDAVLAEYAAYLPLEALPPDVLAREVRQAVEEWLDLGRLDLVVERESAEREAILVEIERLGIA